MKSKKFTLLLILIFISACGSSNDSITQRLVETTGTHSDGTVEIATTDYSDSGHLMGQNLVEKELKNLL